MKLVMRYNAGDESVGNIDVTLPIEHESVDSAELVFLTLCELNMKDGHIGSFIFKGHTFYASDFFYNSSITHKREYDGPNFYELDVWWESYIRS